jgi:hypothetical protein
VSTPATYGTIYISTDRNITLSAFGGAAFGSHTSANISVTGYNGTATPYPSSAYVYAGSYITATNDLALPAGYYNFYLTSSYQGSSGNNAGISCGTVTTYTPTPSPTPSPGTSGGGGGGGGGMSGIN